MAEFIRPAPGPISSPFGPRNIGGKASTNHLGADIGCGEGTAVVASAAGRVAFAGSAGGFGYLVRIDHAGADETYYAHLSHIGVRYGQTVAQGQVIAASGGRKGHPGAGTSTGPHLHTEHRINGKAVDPAPYWASTAGGGSTPITRPKEHDMHYFLSVDTTSSIIKNGYMYAQSGDGVVRPVGKNESGAISAWGYPVGQWPGMYIEDLAIGGGLAEHTWEGLEPRLSGRVLIGRGFTKVRDTPATVNVTITAADQQAIAKLVAAQVKLPTKITGTLS